MTGNWVGFLSTGGVYSVGGGGGGLPRLRPPGGGLEDGLCSEPETSLSNTTVLLIKAVALVLVLVLAFDPLRSLPTTSLDA